MDGYGTSEEAIADRIADYVVGPLEWSGTKQDLLAGTWSLVEELDSTQLLELAGHVEDEYDVRLGDDEIVSDNFRTVHVLAAFIYTKLAGTD